MNLHVTNDTYGLYTAEIAERVKNSEYHKNNIIVNLSEQAEIKAALVAYIAGNTTSFQHYIDKLERVDKAIFHPYDLTAYEFLQILLKRFPGIKVYWICWSYEFYNLPHVVNKLYEPFSLQYVKSKTSMTGKVRRSILKSVLHIRGSLGIKKNYWQKLKHSGTLVDYFCSPFPTDFFYLNKIIPPNQIAYLPFAYLSLNKIMPVLDNYSSRGDKIMIGHSASPDGNHYEVIKKISSFKTGHSIILPLVYGDKVYAELIKDVAKAHFKEVEVMETKLDKAAYYQKLCEVGYAVINVKVQQAVGNIMGLIWMGAKVFLDKRSSIYIDFVSWGIHVFNIQDHLNEQELSTKLTAQQIDNNKQIMLQNFGEEKVYEGWRNILS